MVEQGNLAKISSRRRIWRHIGVAVRRFFKIRLAAYYIENILEYALKRPLAEPLERGLTIAKVRCQREAVGAIRNTTCEKTWLFIREWLRSPRLPRRTGAARSECSSIHGWPPLSSLGSES